jgi:hypothetical protein
MDGNWWSRFGCADINYPYEKGYLYACKYVVKTVDYDFSEPGPTI